VPYSNGFPISLAGNLTTAGACGGAGGSISFTAGGGGGGEECVKFMIPNPAASYTYAVGPGGAGGTAGGQAGGAGAAGRVEIWEYYNFVLKGDLMPGNDNIPMWLNQVA
jgi:hypothetical protein